MNPDRRPTYIYIYISEDERNLITLLRVIAAFAVLLIHTSTVAELPDFVKQVADYGADGINFFSLLTGYLVMDSYVRCHDPREYWHRRIRRLLPLYYFMLALLMMAGWDWFMKDPLSIPRSVFLLNYILPSPVSYNYSGLFLLGTIPIFMMFYAAIPLIHKLVKKAEGAFGLLLIALIVRRLIGPLYLFLFGAFCPPEAITTMTGYFWEKMVFFLAGVLLYYGKRDGRVPQALLYLLFLCIAGMRYSFLALDSIATFPLLAAILLCYPIPMPRCIMKPLRWLDRLGMGVLVTQMPILIYYSERYAERFGVLPHGVAILPILFLPYCAAIALHYAIELPGQKLVDRLMARALKVSK